MLKFVAVIMDQVYEEWITNSEVFDGVYLIRIKQPIISRLLKDWIPVMLQENHRKQKNWAKDVNQPTENSCGC